MQYIIWTSVEIESLLHAIARAVKDGADLSNRLVIDLAGTDFRGWRPRVFTYARAKEFLQKHEAQLKALMSPEQITYAVSGYDRTLTVEEMREELARLKSKEVEMDKAAMQHRIWRMTHVPVGSELTLKVLDKPEPPTPSVHTMLKAKPRVAIAGVHTKHRHDLEQMYPKVNIVWVEPGEHDANIKRKVSGHIALACTYGCNGKVMQMMQNLAAKFLQGGGVHFVREALNNVVAGKLA